jgi:beta-lactamase class A
MGKVPILVALMQAIAAGDALDERVTFGAGERNGGPTGLSVMTHPAELALDDVAQLMICVRDNHATDIVLAAAGNATSRRAIMLTPAS